MQSFREKLNPFLALNTLIGEGLGNEWDAGNESSYAEAKKMKSLTLHTRDCLFVFFIFFSRRLSLLSWYDRCISFRPISVKIILELCHVRNCSPVSLWSLSFKFFSAFILFLFRRSRVQPLRSISLILPSPSRASLFDQSSRTLPAAAASASASPLLQ